MSAAQEVYGGLAWVGKTEAKIFFVIIIGFYILVSIIILFQLFSNLHIVQNKNNYTPSQVQEAEKQVRSLIFMFLVGTIIFGVIIAIAYFNMKATEESKPYAAASGLLDLVQDVQGGGGGGGGIRIGGGIRLT